MEPSQIVSCNEYEIMFIGETSKFDEQLNAIFKYFSADASTFCIFVFPARNHFIEIPNLHNFNLIFSRLDRKVPGNPPRSS